MQVSVLEMDGAFDKLEELIYVESHLSNTSTKFYGEITQQMLKNSHFPGSFPSGVMHGIWLNEGRFPLGSEWQDFRGEE